MANVNDLKYAIEIWKYDNSDNSGGTPIETFKLYRKVYARMVVNSGGTDQTDIGKLPNTSVTFTIRYDATVDYRCQIKYNDKFYEINHIQIIDREAFMILQCVVYNEMI
jgi:SPP1 family predicted phage head-tail adaptor